MARFITLNHLFKKFRTRGFNTFLDKLTFLHIFIIWISVIIGFGLIYYFFTDNFSFLYYRNVNETVKGSLDYVYFSFITATSTGYGDVLPFGFFKIISILEVVFGLVLLAFVTSKLVSIKQDMILNEIYEISFNEKINRLRSSLLVFRQNISRVIERIEDTSVRRREVSEIYVYIASLEDTLTEISTLIDTQDRNHFKKVLDPLSAQVLSNSIINSFEKLNELIIHLNKARFEWKRDITISVIEKCISINEVLFAKLAYSKTISDKNSTDLIVQKNKVMESIKKGLTPSAF